MDTHQHQISESQQQKPVLFWLKKKKKIYPLATLLHFQTGQLQTVSTTLILINPSSCDGNVCLTKTISTSVNLASSTRAFQGSDATLQPTTRPIEQVMQPISSQKMVSRSLDSLSPVSLRGDKTVLACPGTSSSASVMVPCGIVTNIAQNTAVHPQSFKCIDAEQSKSITAQPGITSSLISRGNAVPASSLNTIKHHGISSLSEITKPVNITYPCTNSSPASSFVIGHDLSTIIISSKSNTDQA